MKRFWIAILALNLALCLCACSGEGSFFEQTFEFPDGTSLLGLDVTGMDKETAWNTLETAAENYTLELNVDGFSATVSGKDMGLSLSQEDFMAAADAMEAGTEADISRIVRFQDVKLRTALGRALNFNPVNAELIYDEAVGQYILTTHADGLQTDHNALAVALKDTIRTLTTTCTLTGYAEVLQPERLADSPEAQAALEQINVIAATQLSYIFGEESSEPQTHTIPSEVIRSLITTGEDGFSPALDPDAVAAYAQELTDTYSIPDRLDGFHTTGGGYLDITIPYESCLVDAEALAQDIILCASSGFTAERPAPYVGCSNPNMPYQGTYVEVDLTAQHLWYYLDGQCLISTDLVSGNAAAKMNTPNGVFDIYGRSRGIYLIGEDYKTFVNYWMPFTGGYGMHDALWRDEFGGDIYLDDGSHGCVNLPFEAAKTLYENSTWGTRVIIYGGEGSEPAREQEIICATEHTVTEGAEPFNLKVRSRYAWPAFFYESDNPDVATVSEDGTVTVNGIGSANIKVIAVTENRYASAEVTVAVHVLCEENSHEMEKPAGTTEATCQSGVQTIYCTKCDYSEEITVEPVYEHSFEDGICSVCGTAE